MRGWSSRDGLIRGGWADAVDLPAEVARREARLKALAEAKAKIKARADARFQEEQRAYEQKVARREARRQAGKKPRGKDPQPPEEAPRNNDQVNLTDEESRIMPVSGGGFEQAYNARAAVDTETMLVIATTVTRQPNDKQQVAPLLDSLQALPESPGHPEELLADNGYFSAANVRACVERHIDPLLALGREAHHLPLDERLRPDAPEPETGDPVVKMAWRLKTTEGRARYGRRKGTVEPVFGIIKPVMGFRQFMLRGLDAVTGEWTLVTLAFDLKRLHALSYA